MKKIVQTFFSKEYQEFHLSHLAFRKKILKSIQITLSLFIIVFLLTMIPFTDYPVQYYIYLPLLFFVSNAMSFALTRIKKLEGLIPLYICLLQFLIPIITLEASLALANEIDNVSKARALFLGVQVGLMYSLSFLTLSSSLHKILMSIGFLLHIIIKQLTMGRENILGGTFVITSIFIFANYVLFQKEMLNLSHWTNLMKRNEGLRHFEKLIQVFPSQILVLDSQSLARDTALYFNTDTQRLGEEVLGADNKSVTQFLELFEIQEGLVEESVINFREPRSLRVLAAQACAETDIGNQDFKAFTVSLKESPAHATDLNSFSKIDNEKLKIQSKWEIKIGSIEWAQKDAVIIIFNDISKSEKIRELKALDQNKDKLLASVSHELRTPLNGIIGMIDVSCEELADENARVRSYLEIARSSAKTLLLMINDILDISQIRKGALRLKLDWTDLFEVIEKVLPLIKVQIKTKQLEFLLDYDCPKGTLVLADPIRLQQILLNLLANACKFTTTGFVKLRACLNNAGGVEEEKAAKKGPQRHFKLVALKDEYQELLTLNDSEPEESEIVEISVEDSGKGIREDQRGNLFRLFGKIETEGNTTGVGLGLAISQSLAKQMHASGIKVESVYGKGSRFSFKLDARVPVPRRNTFRTNIPEEEAEIQNLKETRFTLRNEKFMIKPSQSPARVLVVDDDHTNHLVIELYLKALSQAIVSDKAYNGEEALELVAAKAERENYYNVILMDCDMPVMNGFQACKNLREWISAGRLPTVKIVALTANASLSDKEYCLQQGMDDVWTKPISRGDFIKKFKDILK